MCLYDSLCLTVDNHGHCAYCGRVIDLDIQEKMPKISFCSIECSCYSGRYSIRDGLINTDAEIKKGNPKIPWFVPEEEWDNYILVVTGRKLSCR
mgnify:CR=1 FL=1